MATSCGFTYEQLPCSKELNRRLGRADMTGELFEVGVATLIFIRSIFETEGFQMSTNVEGLGDFDDLFLKYIDKNTKRQHACFLQLKHKEKKSVTYNSLCAPNGDFSIFKYYDSWCELHDMLSSGDNFLDVSLSDACEFVLYTNSDLYLRTNSDRICTEQCDEVSLYSSNSEGNAHRLKLSMSEDLESYKRSLLKISNNQLKDDDIIEELKKFNDYKFCQRLMKLIGYPNEFNNLLAQQISFVCNSETWERFLSQLKIYPKQASVQQLDDLVKQEITKYFGTNEKKTEELFSKLKQGTINWWRDGRTFLSDNYAPFWNLILKEHFSDLTSPMFETLEGILELKFKNTSDLLNAEQVLHIRSQSSIHLTCLKVQNSLKDRGYIMLDMRTSSSRLPEVIAFWRHNDWCSIFVLVEYTNVPDIVSDISLVVKTNSKKKVILISSEREASDNVLDVDFVVNSCIESFSLSDLDEESRKTVMDKSLSFQGHVVKLESIVKEQDLVTGNVIEALFSRDEVSVGHEPANMYEFYIPRKLLRRESVNKSVFKNSDDHFAVSGLPLTEMETILESMEETDKSTNKCKFSIINNWTDFHKLCENNGVHWIHKTEDNFTWRCSKGDIGLIKENLKLDSNYMIYDSGKDILNIQQQIILIVDEPGMGKTTELSHVAKELKDDDPSTWVIEVNLNDYTEDLKQDSTDVMKLLIKAGSFNTDFEKSLFEYEIKHDGNIIILFDSFDEICPNYTEKVLTILKELTTFQLKKIFVASRPGLRDTLEKEFATLSFSLKSFSKEDKTKFLTSLCEIHSNLSPSQVHKFVDDLLELTSSSNMHTFTRTPLETMMLFEIFKKESLYNGTTGEISMLKNLDILKLYELFLDRKHQILFQKYKLDMSNLGVSEYYQELYKIFEKNHMICSLVEVLDDYSFSKLHNSGTVTRKYNEFLEKLKAAKERTGILVNLMNDKPVFLHRTFAEYFVGLWLSKNFEMNRELIKQLFLCSGYETVRMFFDRILARHSTLHSAILNLDKDMVKFLLSTSQANANQTDDGGRTGLHVSIMKCNDRKLQVDENCRKINFEIISLLLEYGADPDLEDAVFCLKPLQLATEIGEWNIVGILLRKTNYSELPSLDCTFLQDNKYMILCVAAEGGYVELVEYMLKCGVHVDHKISTGHDICTMLHTAVIHGHLNLVKCLVEKGADIEIMNSFYERTPLMCAVQKGHTDIVEFLIEQGACVNVVDRYGNNELMLATITENSQLIKMFLGLGMDINVRNKKSETPLLAAIRYKTYEAMTLLTELGADINIRDREGNSVLHYAAKFGANKCLLSLLQNNLQVATAVSIDTLNNNLETPLMVSVRSKMWYAAELLLEYGADVNACDIQGNSIIQYAAKYGDLKFVKYLLTSDILKEYSNTKKVTFGIIAAKYGNWEVFNYFFKLWNDVSFTESDGTTVLHYAADYGIEYYITDLLKSGYDINSKDKNKETPLLRAAKNHKWNVVELLLKLGADGNATDVHGNNILFYVCISGSIEYVKRVIELGIDINSRNIKNESPILAAMRKERINVCRLLQKHGADMTVYDIDGNGLIHYLVNFENAGFLNDLISQNVNISSDTEYLKELILFGLNINSRNSRDETPLLIAARNARWDMVNLLIEHGADLSLCDNKGNSVLHHAVNFGNILVMKALLKQKLDVNIKNKAQESPLLRAAKLNKWDMVKQLLESGSDGSEFDIDGNGILHFAIDDISVDNDQLIELLDFHLDVNARNNKLETPILKAARQGKWHLVILLSFYGADVRAEDIHSNSVLSYAIENNSLRFVADLFDF